jgi:hypothetical protein
VHPSCQTLDAARTMKRTTKRSRNRITAVQATTKGKTSHITITADEQTGELTIAEADPSSYRSVVYYKRDSGKDKVLLDMPSAATLAAFDVNSHLTTQFNQILAVDTNKYEVNGNVFAVACVFVVPERLVAGATKVRAIFLNAFVISDPSALINPERIGWHIALQQNVVHGRFHPNDRIAMVVDSELGELPRMNARSTPYYDGHSLPKNVSLLYASADNPTDTLPSALIRACDTHANEIAALVRASPPFPDLQPGDSNFRGWYCIGPDWHANPYKSGV